MAGIYNGPSRGGTRGGRDQFNWDQVKNGNNNDRQAYLGHSVMAPVGRWQKGRDILWYTRDNKDDEEAALQAELKAVKQMEENAMLEALGLKPKSEAVPKAPMDQSEVAELLRRSKPEDEEDVGNGDRVKGLGFTPSMQQGHAAREVMAGEGMEDLGGGGGYGRPGPPPGRPPASPSSSSDGDGGESAGKKRSRSEKEDRKAEKKAKKAAKKEAKREKKREKKEKKDRRERGSDGERGRERGRERSRERRRDGERSRDRR